MATLERASSGTTRTPMNPPATLGATLAWQEDMRALEEQARIAFLLADMPALERSSEDGDAVHSPLQEVLAEPRLVAPLQAGRIRHTAYEYEIGQLSRYRDVVVVVGHDRVADPPDGASSRRRYTNVWRLENGHWRHAHAVSREGA
jgi:hypothetical protein